MVEAEKTGTKGWDPELEKNTQIVCAGIVNYYRAKKGALLDPRFFPTDEMVYLAMRWLSRAQIDLEFTVMSVLPQLTLESQLLFFEAFLDVKDILESPEEAKERARQLHQDWQKDPKSALPLVRRGISRVLNDYNEYISEEDIFD